MVIERKVDVREARHVAERMPRGVDFGALDVTKVTDVVLRAVGALHHRSAALARGERDVVVEDRIERDFGSAAAFAEDAEDAREAVRKSEPGFLVGGDGEADGRGG